VNKAKKFVTSADCPECGGQHIIAFFPDPDKPLLVFRQCECGNLFAVRIDFELDVTRYSVEEVPSTPD